MINLITYEYDGAAIHFADDAYVNLTEMCATVGKLPNDFLRLKSTQDYLAALTRRTGLPVEAPDFNCGDSPQLKPVGQSLIVTSRGRYGSGTWAHRLLAIECARWLSPDVGVWCNEKILEILTGRPLTGIDAKPALKRLEARVADLAEETCRATDRLWRAKQIPGQYASVVYLEAAGLDIEEIGNIALISALRRQRAEHHFCNGSCRRRKWAQRPGGRLQLIGSSEVRTWPGEAIAAALRELDVKFTEPSAEALAAAEDRILYPADLALRRRSPRVTIEATAPVKLTRQLSLDMAHGAEVRTS